MTGQSIFEMEPGDAIRFMDEKKPYLHSTFEDYELLDEQHEMQTPKYRGGNVPTVGFILFGRYEQVAINALTRIGQAALAFGIVAGAVLWSPADTNNEQLPTPETAVETPLQATEILDD